MLLEGEEVIKAYWLPGCTSCLRMKEFLESTGLNFEAIDLDARPERFDDLRRFGLLAPAVVVGDDAVAGLDLVSIARLIGYDYQEPPRLGPAALMDKYDRVSDSLESLVAQVRPEDLEFKLPDRDRTLAELAGHAASIMRAFLEAYDENRYVPARELPTQPLNTCPEIIEWSRATRAALHHRWTTVGFDDPLDRVIETHWGHRTLHEVFERSVWHPAQHTRQVALFIEELGGDALGALTADDLAGLPVPERVHA